MSTDSVLSRLRREQPSHLTLLLLLRKGRALTLSEISDELDVGKRQVRRLVKRLRAADVPIQEQSRGREKEYTLPPEELGTDVQLRVTEREALSLLLAAGAAESGLGSPPLQEALTGAVETLVEELPSSVTTFEPDSLREHLHFGEAASVDVDPAIFMALVEALGNRRAVAMDYYSASSDRRYTGRAIEPWGLAVRGDTWLCVAHDHRHEERRDFSLARMEAVRPRWPDSNGGDYTIPDGFDLDLYFAERFESLAGGEVHEVRLRVAPAAVPYFRSKQYHGTQQIHADAAEGDAVVVSYEVQGLREIASMIRGWGPRVMVLEPPALAEQIAADARAVAAQYDTDP